jgi:precorrin-4 methylase
MQIHTVSDLIAELEQFDDDTPIALATQPSWPFEHTISGVEQAENGTVYIAEGNQVAYLPDTARKVLGW